MKTAVIVATVAAIGTAAFFPAQAGDREWATAGKVLAGVAVAGVGESQLWGEQHG